MTHSDLAALSAALRSTRPSSIADRIVWMETARAITAAIDKSSWRRSNFDCDKFLISCGYYESASLDNDK